MKQFPPLEILCEDGPVIAINKPAGLLTQGGPPGNPDTVVSLVKDFLKEKYHKPGNVYLGVPHRLDRPVTGVLVLSRNSKAAARLAEQFRERTVRKIYWAVVEGVLDEPVGELVDWLVKLPDQAHVEVASPERENARESRLRYRTLTTIQRDRTTELLSLVEVELLTGRSHQIRVQFASRGHPIVGDTQYGSTMNLATLSSTVTNSSGVNSTGMNSTGANSTRKPNTTPQIGYRDQPIALHARSLTIMHPIRYEPLEITAPPPRTWSKWTEQLPKE